MTALLTMERTRLSDKVTASSYVASPIESKLSLRPGEQLSVADLVRGLMLESANDAAVTLAEHISGSRAAFVRLMNRRARGLGLENTHFANPIGLDEHGNYSSAHDLARLAVELRKHSFVRKVADRTSATLSTGYRTRTIRNRNTLLSRGPRTSTGSRPATPRRPATCSWGPARVAASRSCPSCSARPRWRRATRIRWRC